MFFLRFCSKFFSKFFSTYKTSKKYILHKLYPYNYYIHIVYELFYNLRMYFNQQYCIRKKCNRFFFFTLFSMFSIAKSNQGVVILDNPLSKKSCLNANIINNSYTILFKCGWVNLRSCFEYKNVLWNNIRIRIKLVRIPRAKVQVSRKLKQFLPVAATGETVVVVHVGHLYVNMELAGLGYW